MEEEAVDQKEHEPGDENTELKNDLETPTDQPSAEGQSPTTVDPNDPAESPADKVVTDEGGSAFGEENAEEVAEVTPEEHGEAPVETEGANALATPRSAGGAGDAGAELPTSDTFDEGEIPETTLLIGAPLSRRASLTLENEQGDDDEDRPPKLDPGTPESERHSPEQREAEKDEEEEEEEEEEGSSAGPVAVDYEEYMGHLKQLQAERERLSQVNGQLQVKLAEYFRKKSGGDDARPEKQKQGVSDQEQRYRKYMATMEELREQHRRDSDDAQLRAEELRLQTQEKLGQVEREWGVFMALKRDVAVAALSRRRGKQAAQEAVEEIQAAERRREGELARARLENVRLKNGAARLESALRAKEELAEGLHLIDFEQLKIENQTYSEKIEERNEELLKLRKKITSTVQVLTHVKEKLQFVQTENQAKRAQLAEEEAAVARKRDVLTRTKQARDGLRADDLRLRRRCGLLGNAALLRDLEEKADASEGLEERLEGLRRRHAGLVLQCAGVKKKLEQSRPVVQ